MIHRLPYELKKNFRMRLIAALETKILNNEATANEIRLYKKTLVYLKRHGSANRKLK